jgi:phospholipase/lecithinase/hemolysin
MFETMFGRSAAKGTVKTAAQGRRGFLAGLSSIAGLSAVSAAGLLSACGSGTIESALKPTRVISFGDAMSDLGQNNGVRQTVNDGTVNMWTAQMASNFGLPLTASSAGGTSYAQSHARVTGTPDAAGNAATLSITQQIDKFIAADKFGPTDLVLVNGGISDIIFETAPIVAGTTTSAQMIANVAKAGQDFATQIQRLVTAGAKYVVVTGTYNLSRSPWAKSIGQTVLLDAASSKFNEQLLVNIVNLGSNVLYADAAYYYNLVTAVPSAYNLLDSTVVACNSVDAGVGIGIGKGQVNAALCSPTTITTGLDYTKLVFADPVYFTPVAQSLFGNYAYTRLKARW